MEAPKRINLDVLKQGDDWIAMEHGAVSLSPASEYVQNVAYVRAADADALADLLHETLQPGAYGIGSNLAERIERALAAYRETK